MLHESCPSHRSPSPPLPHLASGLVFHSFPSYDSFVRRLAYSILVVAILLVGQFAQAASGKVIKVLPLLLDHKGRHMLSPSLYERDAYQAVLRDSPDLRSGMKFSVQWKAKGKTRGGLLLRAELRGIAQGNLPRQMVLEKIVTPGRWFTTWTELSLAGDQYAAFGEVTAWRITLWQKGPWDEELLLGEQKSFLW